MTTKTSKLKWFEPDVGTAHVITFGPCVHCGVQVRSKNGGLAFPILCETPTCVRRREALRRLSSGETTGIRELLRILRAANVRYATEPLMALSKKSLL